MPPDVSKADGYRQEFSGDDLYFDSHWAVSPTETLSLITGIDLLASKGRAESENFEYHTALDGSAPPPSSSFPIDERPEMEDERAFGGAYVQALWKPAPRWSLEAGLRLNITHEKMEGEVEENGVPTVNQDTLSETRPSGGIGASFLAWGKADSAVWVFANVKNTFKPAAVDFGPEAEGEILDPETATSSELGIKGSHMGGRFDWQVSGYWLDFDNLVISQSINGLPSLTNAGQERFKGIELAARWRPLEAVSIAGSYASHSAEFVDYLIEFDGEPTQLAGNTLEMSADRLAALGVTWSPEQGFLAYAVANYVGERFLNKRNTVTADPYTTISAGVGYRFAKVEARLDAYNLTDERPPVAESELGDAQYYRLPARSFRAGVLVRF